MLPVDNLTSIVYSSYMNNTSSELNKQVILLIWQLDESSRVMDAHIEELLRPWHLTKAKMSALRQLMEAGEPLPLGQLAERLHCGRSNATTLVDRLESDGYAERLHERDDRRTVRARLTPQGRDAYLAGMARLQELEREVLAQFSLDDLQRFNALLSRLIALWE
jgi:DNA-binding MarR family transcriptional regulator